MAALILAGGIMGSEWDNVRGETQNRALLTIDGETMVTRTVRAVRGAENGTSDGRILVAGLTQPIVGTTSISGGDSLVQTLLNGVAALHPHETRLLVATADMPFLSSEAVSDFLRQSADTEADFVYPIVPVALCHAHFPKMRRTALKTADGTFTGGNLALVRPAFLREHQALIESVYSRRKSVVQVARLLGGDVLRRFALSFVAPQVLSVEYLEQAIGRVLGGTAKAVMSEFPEIATDVDTPNDFAIARRMAVFTNQAKP